MSGRLGLTRPEDREYLRLFEEVTRDLRRHSVLRRPQLLSWSWNWKRGQRARFRHHLHDPDRITAFLADVRKFHVDKEPLQLPKVFSWLRHRLTDAALVSELDELRRAYKAALRSGGVRIVHGGRQLSPRELLDIYLHGKYFHSDAAKRALIQQLEAGDLVPRVVAIEAAVAVAFTAFRVAAIVKTAQDY